MVVARLAAALGFMVIPPHRLDMAPRFDLATGVECDHCGLGKGTLGQDANAARCDECGRFAETSDEYCGKHEVNIRRLGAGYNHCPRCREEDRVNRMEQEMHARRSNPRMHPTVDAKRF